MLKFNLIELLLYSKRLIFKAISTEHKYNESLCEKELNVINYNLKLIN